MTKTVFDDIREWAEKRGIYDSGDIETQTIKLIEEFGEIAKAKLRGDNDEVKDGIGDCVVVLTNLAHLLDSKIEDCVKIYVHYSNNKRTHKSHYLFMTSVIGGLATSVIGKNNGTSRYIIGSLYRHLGQFARLENTTIMECTQLAYNEIANRKGKMVDGNFIKQEDL